MKRIFCMVVLCGIILLGVCGCEKKETEWEDVAIIDCSALNDLKITMKFGFITTDNDVYRLNEKKYSNEKNCKKLNDDNVKFNKYYGNWDKWKVFDTTNRIYEYVSNLDEYEDKSGEYSYIIENNDVIKVEDFDGKYYLVLKTDGILYKVSVFDFENYNQNKEITEEIYKSFGNENIIDFSYDKYKYIKTNKAYYIYDKTNKDECNKYADIKCEYDYIKNEYLTERYNDIAGIIDYMGWNSGILAVFKNGNVVFLSR